MAQSCPPYHMMYWSTKKGEGFCDRNTIKNFKSSLTNDIFSNELWLNKEFKNEIRKTFEDKFKSQIDDINKIFDKAAKNCQKIANDNEDDLKGLSKMIPDFGKIFYSYQDKEVKEATDHIVAKILANPIMEPLMKEYLHSQKQVASFYMKNDSEKMNEYMNSFLNNLIHPKKDDRKVLQNYLLNTAAEIKYKNFIDQIIIDPKIVDLEKKITNKESYKEILPNDERLADAILKFKFAIYDDPDIAIDEASKYYDREKVLEKFLEHKDNNNFKFLKKDLNLLNRTFYEPSKREILNIEPKTNVLHSCEKIIQSFINYFASATSDNIRETHRLFAIRRADEGMMRRSKIKDDIK